MAIALRVGVFILAGISMVAPAVAQELRADEIAAAQAEKAKRLAPRTPSGAERALLTAQKALIEAPEGFYPNFGSVLSGGGFTLGAGYRHFLGDRTNWNVAGLYSLSAYKLIETGVTAPGLGDNRLDVRTRLGWRDATQVAFYGLGSDSPADQRTNYRMQQAYAGGEVLARPLSWMRFTGGLTYEDFTLKQGTGTFPSIEEVHTAATAPGLGDNVTYLHALASAGVDSRPAAGYARRGGLYELAYHRYIDRDETYDFDRLDAEVVQHIPILRENWVVSLRGRLQTTVGDEDQVPYFLLPSLGSGSTLRGYSSWRFRDRHSLLLSGEWRWIPNRLGLDMAFFYDAGKVTARLADINLDKLKSDFGIGIRFHGPAATALRIELAKGSEGTRLVFAASPAF